MGAPDNALAPERLSVRSAATRVKLIVVAEQLFARRGIEGVTLAEIGKAAGQRNAAVCQYHFGNKDGLLQAIIDKHVPGIASRRHVMLDQLDVQRRHDVRSVARALMQPVTEKLADPDGGRDFIRISAQLVALHTVASQEIGASPLRLPAGDRLTRALYAAMASQRLPKPVLKQRALLAAVMLFHGLADHLHMLELAATRQDTTDTPLFLQTLEDAIVAVLAGPPREPT